MLLLLSFFFFICLSVQRTNKKTNKNFYTYTHIHTYTHTHTKKKKNNTETKQANCAFNSKAGEIQSARKREIISRHAPSLILFLYKLPFSFLLLIRYIKKSTGQNSNSTPLKHVVFAYQPFCFFPPLFLSPELVSPSFSRDQKRGKNRGFFFVFFFFPSHLFS